MERGQGTMATVEAQIEEILRSRPKFGYVPSREEWPAFCSILRQKIRELSGMNGLSDCALEPEIISTRDAGEYLVEEVILHTRPYTRVPCTVMIPKSLAAPAPAAVCLHGHGGRFDLGRAWPAGEASSDAYERTAPYALDLVLRGYVTVSADAPYFGDRARRDETGAVIPWDEAVCMMHELLLGRTSFATMTWDDMRIVDYLCSRDDVDAGRVAAIGLSMGGSRTMHLAALDERIKVACPCNHPATYKGRIANQAWFGFHTTIPGILRYADQPQILALVAPRPLLVMNGKDDFTYGDDECQAYVRQVYEMLGVPERFDFYKSPYGHAFIREMPPKAYEWIDRWLRPDDGRASLT
ncbi:MAG: hypothetical protein HPY83_04755 [Anaerolineae bacterium]|nr:hypothetical protein [Anaerolineae bacterium]